MKRSSSGSRSSYAPLRVVQDRQSSDGSRSSFGGRPSVSGSRKSLINKPSLGKTSSKPGNKRYSSGYGSHYGHEHLKEPRPVSDKGFKDKSIRELVEFLSKYGYPHVISPKLLHAPNAKDALRIFEFMYQFLNPSYKLPKKHEEEIPRVFKRLGYPFTITKSSMYTIGAPHTWPHVLAAYTWLREQVEHTLCHNVDRILFPPGNEGDFDKPQTQIFYDYVEQTYFDFLSGADTFEEKEEELARQLCQNQGVMTLEEAAEENHQLRKELELLQEKPNKLPGLRESQMGLRAHCEKLKQYGEELDVHMRHLDDKEVEVEQQISAFAEELAAVESELQRKKRIFDTQEFSRADVERINMGRQELQKQIEFMENQRAAIDKQIWSEEMAYSKCREQFELKRIEYNKQLNDIPEEEGFNLNLAIDETPQSYGGLAIGHLQRIKPALNMLKSTWNNKVYEARNMKLNEEEEMTMLQEMVASKEQELQQQESHNNRLDEDLTRQKEAYQQERAKIHDMIQSMQERLKLTQQESALALDEVCEQREKLRRDNQAKSVRTRHEKEEYCKFLYETVKMVVEHKTTIQDHVSQFRKEAEQAAAQSEAELQQTLNGTLF